jgi:hypothetical protein
VTLLWRQRSPQAQVVLAATIPITVIWAYILMGRRTDFVPWLRPTIAVVGLGAALTLLLLLWRNERYRLPYGRPRLALAGAWLAGLLACLAGPTAYSLVTAATPHEGAIPPAGPPPVITGPQLSGPGGGLVDATNPGVILTHTLLVDADRYTWVAATVGSNNAAGYQLATRRPVMAIGGFNGSDPSPTLEEFQRYVAAGQIHYFIEGYRFNANGGSRASFDIVAWVSSHYSERIVDGAIIFDLTQTPWP